MIKAARFDARGRVKFSPCYRFTPFHTFIKRPVRDPNGPDVRFTPKIGHCRATVGRLLCAALAQNGYLRSGWPELGIWVRWCFHIP